MAFVCLTVWKEMRQLCLFFFLTCGGGERERTVGLLLDLECDGLPGHLKEMDGLAQWLPFQTDPIDGQHSVPYVDGPSSAG